MHMCPQDIENSSPCGTEIKLHKVKNKIILAICYWLKIISHFPSTPVRSRKAREIHTLALSGPLSQKRDFYRCVVMHASKALLEVTGPHWEGQALVKTRGFEVLEVPSNSHASAFRHLSKWQMNRHFLEETNQTPFEDKGWGLKKRWAPCLWFIRELTKHGWACRTATSIPYLLPLSHVWGRKYGEPFLNLSSTPGPTWLKERTNFHKLSW